MGKKWLPLLVTFAFWCILGASLAFWLLHWQGKSDAKVPAHAKVAGLSNKMVSGSAKQMSAALGAQHFQPVEVVAVTETSAPEPVATAVPVVKIDASRFRMGGILAQNPGNDGLAILSVDGKKAELFSVGQEVAEGVVLRSLSKTKVELAARMDAEPEVTLEIGKSATGGSQNVASATTSSRTDNSSANVPSLESFFGMSAQDGGASDAAEDAQQLEQALMDEMAQAADEPLSQEEVKELQNLMQVLQEMETRNASESAVADQPAAPLLSPAQQLLGQPNVPSNNEGLKQLDEANGAESFTSQLRQAIEEELSESQKKK